MNTMNLPTESLDTSPLPQQPLLSSLDESKGLRETSDNPSTLSCLLRRFEKDAGNWIQESPAEAAIRFQGLRKITFALFALSILLTFFLNSILLQQGVELQLLIVCNIGIMVLYVLAGISLLHDITIKRKAGFQKEVLGVVERIELVSGQIEELDALRFKMLCNHKKMVANKRNLSAAVFALATQNKRESEIATQSQELIALAQAELLETQAAVVDETTKLAEIQSAVTTLESDFQAKRVDHSAWLGNQQGEMERLKAEQDECRAITEQITKANYQAEETAHALKENLAQLQAELKSLEIQKIESIASHEQVKLELLDIEKNLSNATLTLTTTQEEREKVTGTLAAQQDALQAVQDKHSQLLLEIDYFESDRETLAQLQAEIQSLDIQKAAIVESQEQFKRELLDKENIISESNLALTRTQEECDKVTEALAAQQDALQAVQEKHSQLLLEIELLESEKAASQSSLASSKLELACAELECIRVQKVLAEQPLITQASADLEQLNSLIVSIEQSICDMEQERSSLQRNIEYSNAIEAVASNRLANLNEQVSKLESDRVGLSAAMERILGEIEEKSRLHEGLTNQNMSATASLEGLLDSVEKLSCNEASLLSACTSAEQKMGDWTTNVESLVNRVDELTTQIATFEEQRLQAIEVLENILEEIDLKSADRATIADSIESTTKKASDLDAMTQAATTRRDVAESAMQETESALQDQRNQLETYETELSQASENCIAQQTELSRVQQVLLTELCVFAQLQSEIAHKTEDRIAVENDLAELAKLKKETQIACDDANAELERFIQQLDAMSEELMTKEEQSLHLNTKLGQLRELDSELNLKHQKLDELDKQQLQSEQSCEDVREQLSQLQADTRTVQLDLDRLRRTESELTLKSNNMRSENEQLEATYDSSNHKVQTLQHELSVCQLKRSQLESEIQTSEQRRSEIQRTLDGYANEADEAQAVCKQWADYGTKLRIDNKEVESEIDRLRLEIKELRAEQDRSLQEKQALTAGLSTLKGQRDTLNTEIANREDFLLELKEEQKQVVKQIAANNHCLEQTQADLDRLAGKCNSANLELDGIHHQRSVESTCVQELAVQHQQLQGEVHSLTQVLEQLRADAEKHEVALETQKTNRALMDDSIIEAKAQQLDLANRMSTMQRELATASEAVAAAVEQEQKYLSGNHSLQSEANEYRIQIDSLQRKLKSIEFEFDENRENAKRLDSKLEATRNECQQAEKLLLESQNKSQEIIRSIADREKELAETQQSISGKQLQSQSLDVELSQKNAVLDISQQAIANAESKATEQQTQLVQVQNAVESLRSQAVALECNLVELSGRKAEADASIADAASHSKDLQNLIEALESEKTSQRHLLEAEKTQLDSTIHERVQLESANSKLEVSNDSMLQAIRGLQSQRDEFTKLVSDLDAEIGSNKKLASQLQTQIEASSAQIAQLEQSRREWMDKESTTIEQVARMEAELKNLESQQLQAKQKLEAMVAPTQSNPKAVLDRRSVKLLPDESAVTEPTTVELAQEILEEISDLVSFDNTIVGQGAQTDETDFAETSQKESSVDPWSVVLQ